jgi:hypothetical protein
VFRAKGMRQRRAVPLSASIGLDVALIGRIDIVSKALESCRTTLGWM